VRPKAQQAVDPRGGLSSKDGILSLTTAIPPHGGSLAELLVEPERASELKENAWKLPGWRLTRRQLCDLDLLACGGFSPLQSFLGERDYLSVCESMRLADGTLWPIPVMLDVPDDVLAAAERSGALSLLDPQGVVLAVLQLAEAWRPDVRAEAMAVLGTVDPLHPSANHLLNHTNPWYLTGRLEVLQLPEHWDFQELRHSPRRLRREFERRGWQRVVAFNTRNPMHRAHLELTHRAAERAEAHLLIHPIVGVTKPGDIDHYTRVRCIQAIMPRYRKGEAMISLLPLAMRMAGPREAVWHAIIRRNYGATHLIVGRDHAGPGVDSRGRQFYEPYEAQELMRRHEAELRVTMVPFTNMVYLEAQDSFVPEEEAPAGGRVSFISGTELRRRLAEGSELPSWLIPPEVAAELRRSRPSRSRQGFTVFFTGLSGAGKSTIAHILCAKLLERGGRHVTLLDGDMVRQLLSSELGFSREHRDLNILRIGYVAAEITKAGGIAVCAPIAPYDSTRRQVRRMVEEDGSGFVLVHVATPLEVCEERDRKGLYAKARAGQLPNFTGITDPYEEPADAEVVIDTRSESAEAAALRIIDDLRARGHLSY